MGGHMAKLGLLGCVGLLLLVGVVVLIVGVGGYNNLNGLSNDVDGKWANVQAQYQRRADLIPNLVQTVQGSANFEKSTLTDVINARANATKVTIDPSHAPTDPAQLEAFSKAQGQLTSSLSRLLVSVERYPDLKSTQGFRDLQAQLEGTEKSHQRFPRPVQQFDPELRHRHPRLPGRVLRGRGRFPLQAVLQGRRLRAERAQGGLRRVRNHARPGGFPALTGSTVMVQFEFVRSYFPRVGWASRPPYEASRRVLLWPSEQRAPGKTPDAAGETPTLPGKCNNRTFVGGALALRATWRHFNP